MEPSANPLLTGRAPEAALSVQLHPLVLLTITDYITRHVSRQQSTPILGVIIGQQNGRTITLEHAYECKTSLQTNTITLDAEWFVDRLEQYKDVHKAPALDLVGIFMPGSTEGPDEAHLQAVKQAQKLSGNDAVMLLLFHAEMVDDLQGGKLPITLYESVIEQQEGGMMEEREIKFREVSFEVETGDAEMIGVDFVAVGGGNATAVPKASDGGVGAGSSSAAQEASSSKDKEKKPGKGKGKSKDKEAATTDDGDAEESSAMLSAEDEELVASLTAKANSIKMLNQRLNLIRGYLSALPPSYLTDPASSEVPADDTNHTLLRSIQALLSRLPLLAPPIPDASAVQQEQPSLATAASKEQQSVHLTTLLATLTRTVSEAQALGLKFHAVNREKMVRDRSNMLSGPPRGSSGRFGDDMMGMMGDGPAGGQSSVF